MRLSELSTDRASDVLCEISIHLLNISRDEELLQELKDTATEGKSVSRAEMIVFATDRIARLIPLLMKKHKTDVFGVLAALNGKTIAEIAKQNIIVTMCQIREAIKDKELVNFIKSCVSEESE